MKICPQCDFRFEHSEWFCHNCGYLPEQVAGIRSFAPELAQTCEGFEAHYFEQLVTLEAKKFWFRSRNRLLLWALKTYFRQSSSFLEISCGTGFVLSAVESSFPAWQIQGSEVFLNGLKFAEQRLVRGTLLQIDARKIPFAEEFDIIGAFDVLEHILEDTHVLAEMYRATRQGIILTVPQHPWLWSQTDEYAHHIRRYQARELRHQVESVGFQVRRMTSFVSVLLPLMLASRWGQRTQVKEFDPVAELKIGDNLNRFLESALTAERQLIKAGVNFPCGGLLLLIAQKPSAGIN